LAFNWRGGTGSSDTTCMIVSSAVAALNGGRPVRHSYNSAPSAYTSAAGPIAPDLPPACSGAMYDGVPMIAPGHISSIGKNVGECGVQGQSLTTPGSKKKPSQPAHRIPN
jgi:hypothetical protein